MLICRRRVVGCLAAAAAVGRAAGRARAAEKSASLAGQLLVASPRMQASGFAHSVVLMVEHGEQGALGLMINRPMGERPLAELLQAMGESPAGAHGSLMVFLGGPVEPTAAFVVHSGEYHLPATHMLGDAVAVSPPGPVLRDIGAGGGPRKRMLMLGYAGWSPGQLEGELALDAWVVVPASPELVFDTDRAKLWDAALGGRTINL